MQTPVRATLATRAQDALRVPGFSLQRRIEHQHLTHEKEAPTPHFNLGMLAFEREDA
jgi:hypothetical protein